MKHDKIKRILLINPFKYGCENRNVGVDPVVSRHSGQEIKTGVTFPIGLAYMAAMLLRKDYEVRMLDPIAERIPISRIHDSASWSDAIIMPFSVSHMEDTKKFRLNFRDKFFILGGGYSKFVPDMLFDGDYCDAILNGEPEKTIVELIDSFPSIENVAGIIYKKNGRAITAPSRPLIENLDELPFPERGLLNPNLYWDISFYGLPTAWILPARGCPFDCIFCAQFDRNTKSVRYRSAKNIVDEMEAIVNNSGVRNFAFFDETFNVNDKQVRAICNEILARKLHIKWWCAARADLVKEDTAILMKRSGCIEMRVGLESANDDVLKYLQKDITVEKIRNGLKILKKVGINFSLQCIFGSPMENRVTVRNTMEFIKEVGPLFVSFNVLTPLPGSQLFDDIKDKINIEALKSFDILHTDFPLGKYSGEDLSKIIKRAYISYYFSLGYLMRILKEAFKRPRLIYFIIKTLVVQGLYVYRSILQYKPKLTHLTMSNVSTLR